MPRWLTEQIGGVPPIGAALGGGFAAAAGAPAVAPIVPNVAASRAIHFDSAMSNSEAIEGGASKLANDNDMSMRQRGETTDSYLIRQSTIRRMREEISARRDEVTYKKKPGSLDYVRAMAGFKKWAFPMLMSALRDEEEKKTLPDALTQGMPEFDNADQFYEVVQLYGNLDCYGNKVARDSDRWEFLFDPGSLSAIFHLMAPAIHAGMAWKFDLRPNTLFGGEKSTAKSYVLRAFQKQMSPGCCDAVAHKTDMANTTSTMRDLKVEIVEEASGVLIGGSGPNRDAQVASKGNQVNKARLTNPTVETHTLQIKDGVRTLGIYVSSNIGLICAATNEPLPPEDDPTRARFITIMFQNNITEPDNMIANKIDQLDAPEVEPWRKEALRTRRLLHMYIILFEIFIYVRLMEDVQMDAYTMYTQRFCDKMAKRGFVITDPKRRMQMRELARSITLGYAIEIGMMSDISYDLRHRTPTTYVRFDDHGIKFIESVQAFCFCTLPISVHTYSICKELWANELAISAIAAARAMTIERYTEMFDASCFATDGGVEQGGASMAQRANADGGCFEDTDEFHKQIDGMQYAEAIDGGDRMRRSAILAADSSDPLAVDEQLARQMSGINLHAGAAVSGRNDAESYTVEIDDDERRRIREGGRTNHHRDADDDFDDKVPPPAVPTKKPAMSKKMKRDEEKALTREQMEASDKYNGSFMGMFHNTFPFTNGQPAPNANYVAVRGAELGIKQSCQALVSNTPGKEKASLANMLSVVETLVRTEIEAPVYSFDPLTMKVHASAERARIPAAIVPHNTKLYDPHNHNGGTRPQRLYIALHLLLNNHSLNSAIIDSVRSMGYEGSKPRSCIVNIPVNSRRFRNNGKLSGDAVTMHGIYRVVYIPPSSEKWIFRQPRVYDSLTLQSVASTTIVDVLSVDHVPMLAQKPAFFVRAPPEAMAARKMILAAGFPEDSPLVGIPETLDLHIRLMRERNNSWQKRINYTYPLDKMSVVFERQMQRSFHRVKMTSETLRMVMPSLSAASVTASTHLPRPEVEEIFDMLLDADRRAVRDHFVDMLNEKDQRHYWSCDTAKRASFMYGKFENYEQLWVDLETAGIRSDQLFAADTPDELATDANGTGSKKRLRRTQVETFAKFSTALSVLPVNVDGDDDSNQPNTCISANETATILMNQMTAARSMRMAAAASFESAAAAAAASLAAIEDGAAAAAADPDDYFSKKHKAIEDASTQLELFSTGKEANAHTVSIDEMSSRNVEFWRSKYNLASASATANNSTTAASTASTATSTTTAMTRGFVNGGSDSNDAFATYGRQDQQAEYADPDDNNLPVDFAYSGARGAQGITPPSTPTPTKQAAPPAPSKRVDVAGKSFYQQAMGRAGSALLRQNK